jgi:hypothetical protein
VSAGARALEVLADRRLRRAGLARELPGVPARDRVAALALGVEQHARAGPVAGGEQHVAEVVAREVVAGRARGLEQRASSGLIGDGPRSERERHHGAHAVVGSLAQRAGLVQRAPEIDRRRRREQIVRDGAAPLAGARLHGTAPDLDLEAQARGAPGARHEVVGPAVAALPGTAAATGRARARMTRRLTRSR